MVIKWRSLDEFPITIWTCASGPSIWALLPVVSSASVVSGISELFGRADSSVVLNDKEQ